MSRPQSVTAPHRQQAASPSAGTTAILSEFRPGKNENPEHDPYKLDFLFANNLVQYKCSCGKFCRLNETYFCRHCMAMRCKICVAYEVDSQYCQHCLEYIPTIDPKFQMNKCASCYQCPSCQHLLSTSVLSISPSPSEQQVGQSDEVIKRTCQLVCDFCRWSSDTFVIEGSNIANNMADIETPNIERISELMSFYKAISQKEKTDKKKRRFHARSGNTMDLLKKYGIDNTLSPKLFESLRARTTYHDKSSSATKYNLEPKGIEEAAIETFKPAEARKSDGLEKLDYDYYYDPNFNIETVSGIEQRLAQIEVQPTKVSEFKPISKSLSVKRSLRCKECERNLCRSEYSPVSIRFKIQSAAYYHVPEIRLRSDIFPVKLKVNEENIVEFCVQNQTLSQVKLKFKPLEAESNRQLYTMILPPPELSLGPKDDTADHEHVPLQIRPLNEDTHLTFQSPSRIGFFIKVTPNQRVDTLPIEFRMSHDILSIQNPKENERVTVSHQVRINLGPVV